MEGFDEEAQVRTYRDIVRSEWAIPFFSIRRRLNTIMHNQGSGEEEDLLREAYTVSWDDELAKFYLDELKPWPVLRATDGDIYDRTRCELPKISDLTNRMAEIVLKHENR